MHFSKNKKINAFILSSCAVLALSACSKNDTNPFSTYKGSNEAYVGETYVPTETYNVAQSEDSNQSREKSANNPAIKIEIEDEPASAQSNKMAGHQSNQFVAEGDTPDPTSTIDQTPDITAAIEPTTTPQASNSPYAQNITGCPMLEIYPSMKSITFFKGGDRTKLIADASIGDLRGACVERGDTIDIDLKMLVDARIGEHGRYQTDQNAEELQSYPYYLALVNKQSQAVEYKKIFASIIKFPSNQSVQSKYEDIFVTIPMPKGQTKDSYILNIGFQLTDEQLAYNEGTIIPSTRVTTPAPQTITTEAAQPMTVEPMMMQSQPVTTTPTNIATEITPRKSRFLSDRPRVSADPLGDSYGGTFVTE